MASQITSDLLIAIHSKKIDASSAVSIVVKTMELAEGFPALDKKSLVLETLKAIAVGADGQAGTADDLIKPDVIAAIEFLLNSGVVADMIDALVGAARGMFKLGTPAAGTRKWICC